MTEDEWFAATDPADMLAFLEGRTSDRKYRLFGVACVARLVGPAQHRDLLPVLRTVERYTEGGLSDAELAAVVESMPDPAGDPSAVWACRHLCSTDQSGHSVAAASSVYSADASSVASGEEFRLRLHLRHTPSWGEERRHQSFLLRDVLGNPFRPAVFHAYWLTSNVAVLATGIYDEKAFDRMPILADALQYAGCDTAEVLDHCRGPGPHVRGCYVLDLLLGKS